MIQDPRLIEAFRLLKEVADETGVNLLDNYGYREYTANELLKSYLPSIKKVIGRTGDDASAVEEGYQHIEQKSGTGKGKTLTMTCFPNMMFDKQSDPARRAYIYNYDGLSLSFFEYYRPYPTAMIFVTKDHISKLHPTFKHKQDIKVADFIQRQAQGKNIGHDAIVIKLQEIVATVGEQNLVCWLHDQQVPPVDFFRWLSNKEIKINQ